MSEEGARAAFGGSIAPIDSGAGPVVVLVHGQPGAGGDWRALADLLSADHRVIAPDRPGWGADDRAALGIAANAEMLEQLLEAAGAQSPVTVVGHSLGGGVAIALALKHPERVGALVLVGSVGVAGSLSGFDRLLGVPLLGNGIVRAGVAALRRALIARDAGLAAPSRVPGSAHGLDPADGSGGDRDRWPPNGRKIEAELPGRAACAPG